MKIQIGKYKRPGIFLTETDQSVFTTPIVEGVQNLVIGVSKKGTPNSLIRLNTLNDLEAIYGTLDRNLERKGSYFHRTVAKMLESSPVYALNLLLTDDNLDRVDYKSLSTAPLYDNDILRDGAYRRFFDTTGFWKRDTESFINLVRPNVGSDKRAFNITNLSDTPITVFIVKSNVAGYDRTLIEWYGTIDNMPSYLNANDYASDYLVDVVVVSGDWTNYRELSVDTRWARYFNPNGLIKEELASFANDRNIKLLAYYDAVSLIPHFRDLENRTIYIETVINNDTDRTGLYCAVNIDLIEQEFYTGLLDLQGATLVGTGKQSIDFLSYKENIVEQVNFKSKPLDLPGNVIGIRQDGQYGFGSHAYGMYPKEEGFVQYATRTDYFMEGAVYNILINEDTPYITGTGSTASTVTLTLEYSDTANQDAFVVMNGEKVTVDPNYTFTTDSTAYAVSAATASYYTTFVVNNEGVISSISSTIADVKPNVSTSDIVLFYLELKVRNGGFVSVDVKYGSINGLILEDDYRITDLTNVSGYKEGDLLITFLGTNTQPNARNYEQYRRFKTFNTLVSYLDSPAKEYGAIVTQLTSTFTKHPLKDMEIMDIVTATTQNKSFVLRTNLTYGEITHITAGNVIIYKRDDEFYMGNEHLETSNYPANGSMGIVARYSELYEAFENGTINTGDFFYVNRKLSDSLGNQNTLVVDGVVSELYVRFVKGEASPSPTAITTGENSVYAGYDYIVLKAGSMPATTLASELDFLVDERLKFPQATINTDFVTIARNSVNPSQTPAQLATALGFSTGHIAFEIVENIDYEAFDVDYIFSDSLKVTLKMVTDANDNLRIDFMNDDMTSSVLPDRLVNETIAVMSEIGNFKQTLEIETVVGYENHPNKMLVNGERYSEVKVGDFILADVSNVEMQDGQDMVKKYVRVLSKRRFNSQPELTEISCDGRILKTPYVLNGTVYYQTTRYSSVDQYATTYKGIALKGFKVRQASLPDGTEERQNQILNLVAKGTPLFKALTNKEAVDFRYLVDSFGLGLTERSKQQLVDICGTRLDLFGFINMPSLKMFKNSMSPTFVNEEGVLKTEYIAKGGNPESNPAFLYSFGDGDGVSAVGYFLPYVKVNDNGRSVDVPPAPYVASTYMRKHNSNIGSVTPWTVCAGITHGKLTGITGLEHEFDPEDIEFLNGAMMNPLTTKRNRGFVIETENTALTLYKSALGIIHVREVLIELERELAEMLQNYQWKYNTPEIRAEIKMRADSICETYKNRFGLYEYFNKIDGENNTNEIIDNQMGILDTYVEPIKAMGIIVNNVTILPTGALSSGFNFYRY